MNGKLHILKSFLRAIWVVTILMGTWHGVQGQNSGNRVDIRDGKVILTIQRDISEAELQSIREHFELEELPIEDWLNSRKLEGIAQHGWKLEKWDNKTLQISRPAGSIANMAKLEKKLLATTKHATGDALYPLGVFRNEFGHNQLRQADAVVIGRGKVTIQLAGFKNAMRVELAGSFTRWEFGAMPMQRTADGWMLTLALEPGKYFYKFIVDGHWVLHKENMLKENDGKGNMNSVLFVPNHTFELKGYASASRANLAGSFNGWNKSSTALQKVDGKWQLPVYLPEGTHTYRFLVDGHWMADPVAREKLPNEFGEYNSVVRVGKPYVFRLDGFQQARQVKLAGSFNQWKDNELLLEKRNGGWELSYAPGQGNHEYYYLVDGDRIGPMPPDGKRPRDPLNFNLIIGANHTISLKGYNNAGNVFLSGSFNNWSRNGFPMKWENGEWKLKVYLPPGKHLYKFVVDGKWIIDPANPLWEQNAQRTKNSVLWVE